MPHALHAAAESWSLPVPVTLLLVGTAALYVNGWRRVRAVDSEASVWHLAGFLSGVLLIWIPVASPLASWDGGSLTVHMIQHLLLMTCAPPLILLSDPVKYLVSGLPALLALATSVAIRSRPMRSVADVVAHPLVCWLAATAALVAWHVPAIFALGLQSRAWHATEHASFLVERPALLVAGRRALAEHAQSAMVDRALSVSGHAALRHPVRVPDVLGPRCVLRLPLVARAQRGRDPERSTERRRPDVDRGHTRLSRRRNDRRDSTAGTTVGLARQGVRPLANARGGSLMLAPEPALLTSDASVLRHHVHRCGHDLVRLLGADEAGSQLPDRHDDGHRLLSGVGSLVGGLVDASPAHAGRNAPRRQRRRCAQPVVGASLRRTDAPDGAPPDRRRPHRSDPRAAVRSVPVTRRDRLPRAGR